MVIRSESERRRAEEQVRYLRSELETVSADEQQNEVSRSVANGLRMQISDIENRLEEYKRLKEGLVPFLEADSFDDIGELIIKARIARGWSQSDLAQALEMEQQQVQRYERNDWQKISLWRLQEVAEALSLRLNIYAHLTEGPGALWPGAVYHTPVETIKDTDLACNLMRSALTYSVSASIVEKSDRTDPANQPSIETPVRGSGNRLLVA